MEEIDAQEIKSLAIYKDGKNDTLYFPDNKNFPYESAGRLLRNGRLVQRLRKKAASHAKYVHKIHISVQLEEGMNINMQRRIYINGMNIAVCNSKKER